MRIIIIKLGVGVLVIVLTCVAVLCAVMELIAPHYLTFHTPFRELYPAGTISECMLLQYL